jgi:prepilin-type processing-associated H-X9-DG protein/prepilin-type N-terminal cleavage/methylation domain-containing protein
VDPGIKGRSLAFTLIELLIVVAVIAILAALLFPVFASARRKARQTNCGSNEGQFGKAFTMYHADWDDFWPSELRPGQRLSWTESLLPYLKTQIDTLSCPDVVRTDHDTYRDVPGYAYNNRFDGRTGVVDSKIVYPSVTVCLCDEPWGTSLTNGPDPWQHGIRPEPAPEEAWKRHSGGANYLFCDAHLKWFRPEAIPNPDAIDGSSPTFALTLAPGGF